MADEDDIIELSIMLEDMQSIDIELLSIDDIELDDIELFIDDIGGQAIDEDIIEELPIRWSYCGRRDPEPRAEREFKLGARELPTALAPLGLAARASHRAARR